MISRQFSHRDELLGAIGALVPILPHQPAGLAFGTEATASQEVPMLTRSQIAQYRYDGYLFPFPALSPEELAECNAGLARYEAWLGKPVNEADRRWRSAAYVML